MSSTPLWLKWHKTLQWLRRAMDTWQPSRLQLGSYSGPHKYIQYIYIYLVLTCISNVLACVRKLHKITLQKAYLPSEQKWKTWSVRPVYATEPNGYINWLANFLPMPTASSLTENHLLKSCKRPKNGTATTVTTESSTRTEIATLHDATLDIDLRKGLTHLEDCPRFICSPKLFQLQKGQHSNDAHIHDLHQMFERNVKSLTQNIMSGTGLQLSSWEVFRDVGFLGRVFVTLRWKILHSITVSHPHSPHLEFSHLFQPTRALQVIVHNENAPLSFFCRQSPQDMSNCLLSPLFSKNWHLNLERKKKKNCHKPMLTHPQSCLTYFSTCSDHSFK